MDDCSISCTHTAIIMENFVIGCLLGAAVVGSSVQRTISVEHGNIKWAVLNSIINSASYGYSVYAISHNDWVAFLGTAVGSTTLMAIMAYRNRPKIIYIHQTNDDNDRDGGFYV